MKSYWKWIKKGCRQTMWVTRFPREGYLMKFSWQILPMTDVRTEKSCYDTQLHFFWTKFTTKQNLGLCQNKSLKMGSQAPISQRCGFVKKVNQNHNTEKWALWKPTHDPGSQFAVGKISKCPLSLASGPYGAFSSQKISLGYQWVHL